MKKVIANIVLSVGLIGLLTQSALATPQRAPDAASTAVLFSLAIGALAAVKRFLR